MNTTVGTFGLTRALTRAISNPDRIYMDLLTNNIFRHNLSIYVSRSERRLLLLLFTSSFASHEMICDILWGDDEDGGPEYARRIIHIYKWRLNPVLRHLGLRIDIWYGQGMELIEI